MVQIIQANNLSLHEVKERFNLKQVWDETFFPEWQSQLPEVTKEEKQWLDKVKADFLSLADYPLHEEVVKLTVLAALLFFAGLTHFPFIPVAEKPVEIIFEEDEQVIRGRIDCLLLHQQFWAIVIESKAKQVDVVEALPQALFYMTRKPISPNPIFGLLINGNHFLFVKLQQQGPSQKSAGESAECTAAFLPESDSGRKAAPAAVLSKLNSLFQNY